MIVLVGSMILITLIERRLDTGLTWELLTSVFLMLITFFVLLQVMSGQDIKEELGVIIKELKEEIVLLKEETVLMKKETKLMSRHK